MFNNNKYFKNFKKHRNIIFLSNKISFNKFDNETFEKFLKNKEFYKDLMFNKRSYKSRKNFILSESFENIYRSSVQNLFNNDKFFDLLNILQMTKKINYIFFTRFLSIFFRYSHFLRFIFEFIFILIFLIYFFKTGTFY